jgi:hypothetical protein
MENVKHDTPPSSGKKGDSSSGGGLAVKEYNVTKKSSGSDGSTTEKGGDTSKKQGADAGRTPGRPDVTDKGGKQGGQGPGDKGTGRPADGKESSPGKSTPDKQTDKPNTSKFEKPPAEKPKQLDDTAKNIIKNARDTSKPIEQRAQETVKSIVDKYYSGGAKPTEIKYDPKLTRGLETQATANKSTIKVSKEFMDNVAKDKNFGHRVISVGHEQMHIQQQKDGMGGPKKQPEREFKAHSWSATAQERPGTGSMDDRVRKAYAQEAVRNFDQMNPNDQKKYQAEKEALERRFGLK